MWGLSDEELRSQISQELWMDIGKSETLDYINDLYTRAVEMYSETFAIDLRAPFNNMHFSKTSDVLDFLKKTATSTYKERRQIYCDLVKLTFWFHLIEKTPQMKNAESDMNILIWENFLRDNMSEVWSFNLDIAKTMDKVPWKEYRETDWIYHKKMANGKTKQIPCILRFRWKTHQKMLIKILWSEKWNMKLTDLINDSMGLELEPKNDWDEIYLFESIYFLFKKLGDVWKTDFRQKPGFFSNEELKHFSQNENLHPEFRDFLTENIASKVKKHGSSKYKDCKWQWSVEVEPGMINGLEARVVKKWNKNQSWFSASEIIDGGKVLDALIGLRGWVQDSYIKKIAQSVAKKDTILKDAEKIQELYLSKLIKVQIPKKNKKIYSNQFRLLEIIKDAYEYPEFIVNAIRKHIWSKQSIEEIINQTKNGTLTIAA